MKTTYRAKQALCRVRPADAAQLGSTYEEDVLDALREIYGANVVQNTGLNEKDVLRVIGKAAYYYRTKAFSRARAAAQSLRDAIARDMGIADAQGRANVLKVLFFLEGIGPDRPVLNTYLSPQEITTQTRVEAIKAGAGKIAANIAEGAKDTAREFVQTTGKLVTTAIDETSKALPWYLSPKLLIPVGLLAVVGIYGAPLLKAIPRPKYKANPLPGKRVSLREQAAKKYEEFHEQKPTRRRSIPEIDTRELVQLGDALEIGYRSKKWTGKPENYLHKFGRKVKLHSTPDGNALVITGGELDVTNRGIVG